METCSFVFGNQADNRKPLHVVKTVVLPLNGRACKCAHNYTVIVLILKLLSQPTFITVDAKL